MEVTTPSDTGPSPPTNGKPAKYGASCAGCRRRKQRCDARLPSCSRCDKLHENCVYESNIRNQPSPHLVPLLIKTFDFLQQLAVTTDESSIRPRIREYLAKTPLPSFADHGQVVPPPATAPAIVPQPQTGIIQAKVEEGERTEEIDDLLMHMSLADDGQRGHFGLTSFLWQTPSESVVERLQRRISTPDGTKPGALESQAGILSANAGMVSAWESLAFHKLQLERGWTGAKMVMHLLKVYFSWQYGHHCTVYRPIFMRDMALGGPYFSQFLLESICAAAVLYSDYHLDPERLPRDIGAGATADLLGVGAEYLSRAKALLAVELEKPSNVPAIQGMMILGQRESSCGNASQGWMYTGMAFRAMRDLGIHLDCSRLPIFGFGTLSAEDREIRRRLFWSAFTWDKTISLALGRMPTFMAWQDVSPSPIVDNNEDNDEWRPHFYDDLIPEDMRSYPVQKSWMTTNYRQFAKLCELIQSIIVRLYDGRPQRAETLSYVASMRGKLQAWYDQCPESVKLDTNRLPEHCPPPHIFSTNTLYRATWILLYRIFLPHGVPLRLHPPPQLALEAAKACTHAAEELHLLFMLYQKSFGLRFMTWTVSWSMYSAATINAIDFMSSDKSVSDKASERLIYSLHVLERGTNTTPGTRRSVEIIKQRLRSPLPPTPKHSSEDLTLLSNGREKRSIANATIAEGDEQTNSSGMFDFSLPPTFPAPNRVTPKISASGTGQVSTEDDSELMELYNSLFHASAAPGGSGGNGVDLMSGVMAMPSMTSNSVRYGWDGWTGEGWDS
ncbi:fungal-specific transcription factor domain-domain-containing protein [Naematelia encephala]|uniref:Fungal-specific transcription factor domain-domain-containing protein n=1 Tax=Naematelia encephala TaxID=71784 RepID=A0A1Y2AMF7_9TREE|nr:fungal-specific transcription factor domain-domain-containing protein [Naematelia encephala]